jgi:hypothetical protein
VSARARRLVAGTVIVTVVFGAVAAVVLSGRKSTVGVRPVQPIFDENGRIELNATPAAAAYSPSTGSKLAVLTDRGVALVEEGQLRYVVNSPSIAAFAWFPAETALLVIEGPTPTGGVVVVQTDGRVRGTIPLQRSFQVGAGMAVLADGKRAVLTELRRSPLGAPEPPKIVEIDLTTGSVSDRAEGERPVALDDGTVVADALGTVDGRWVVRDTLVAELGERRHVLARLGDATEAVAVHPEGTEALVVERGSPDPRPRRLRLEPPPEES